MRVAYVDSSCFVAIAFQEPSGAAVAEQLEGFDRLVSSNLLEAELRSALARERVSKTPAPLLGMLDWIHPDRPLGAEMQHVLQSGYLRGADLWHLACALFLRSAIPGLAFVTLDDRQAALARQLGFEPQ